MTSKSMRPALNLTDQNWERVVEGHILDMSDWRASAQKQRPGTLEFHMGWGAYGRACKHFMDYVETHFESPSGFINFMKAELRGMLDDDVDKEKLLAKFNWKSTQTETTRDAESLALIYTASYAELSYMAAFMDLRNDNIKPITGPRSVL